MTISVLHLGCKLHRGRDLNPPRLLPWNNFLAYSRTLQDKQLLKRNAGALPLVSIYILNSRSAPIYAIGPTSEQIILLGSTYPDMGLDPTIHVFLLLLYLLIKVAGLSGVFFSCFTMYASALVLTGHAVCGEKKRGSKIIGHIAWVVYINLNAPSDCIYLNKIATAAAPVVVLQ